jgi:hypothetical protein
MIHEGIRIHRSGEGKGNVAIRIDVHRPILRVRLHHSGWFDRMEKREVGNLRRFPFPLQRTDSLCHACHTGYAAGHKQQQG